MMTYLISLAAKIAGERFAKPLAYAGLVIVAGLALWLVVAMIRGDAQDDLRAEQQAEIARQEAAQREAEAKAITDRRDSLDASTARDRAIIEGIDDATANLPDARPTDRQLRRACAELRFTPPACAGLRPR